MLLAKHMLLIKHNAFSKTYAFDKTSGAGAQSAPLRAMKLKKL